MIDTHTTNATRLREEIARIIDPIGYKQWQALYDYCIREGDTAEEALRIAKATHGEQLCVARKKSDSILALPAIARAVATYATTAPEHHEVMDLLRRLNAVAVEKSEKSHGQLRPEDTCEGETVNLITNLYARLAEAERKLEESAATMTQFAYDATCAAIEKNF